MKKKIKLTEEQLKELLHSQSLDYLILGQIFVDEEEAGRYNGWHI